MEPATIINIFMSVVLMGMGWIMRVIWDSIKRLQRDMNEMERHASETYVRRDDYRDDIAEMKSMLRQLFEIVNSKQDR